MRDPFLTVLQALHDRSVRFLVTGVWGANYYAISAASVFETHDRDLFLPLDPANLLCAWQAAEAAGLSLWVRDEPLDRPRDLDLAGRAVARRTLVRATDAGELEIDFTLVMEGFEFDAVWSERRMFVVNGVPIPVARLRHIVQSNESADRDKDRLFLATHEEALRRLLDRE